MRGSGAALLYSLTGRWRSTQAGWKNEKLPDKEQQKTKRKVRAGRVRRVSTGWGGHRRRIYLNITKTVGQSPKIDFPVPPEIFDHGRDNSKKTIVVGLSIGGALIVVLLVWCVLSWWKWRGTGRGFDKGTRGVRRFKYHQLVSATNQFSMENKIGAGAFGEVHKGYLTELGREVAVKKILKECREGNKDFFDEVQTISRAKQKNLVELLGWGIKRRWNIIDFMCWCRQKKSDLFLVYELVDNGNLHRHLHEEAAVVLPWTARYKIVKDIGCALIYLHHDRKPYILHRDIKPSNILLDKEFNAKLADFGLSRTADNGTIQSSMVVGTANYLDPECMKTGKFDRSSDVYSFGLVLLEIACKKDENSYAQVADDRLRGEFDERQMERVIFLGLQCCQPKASMRPTMQEAMGFLEDNSPLPELAKPEDSSSKSGN
uniref:OSJNBa0042N22.7 protein n=2 Tax=Oryza TaxID=4527 RepID=Q7XPD2_ORYSJ|nr:OSJNBa0042N22.7 [Oryza sativa Japonica Group]